MLLIQINQALANIKSQLQSFESTLFRDKVSPAKVKRTGGFSAFVDNEAEDPEKAHVDLHAEKHAKLFQLRKQMQQKLDTAPVIVTTAIREQPASLKPIPARPKTPSEASDSEEEASVEDEEYVVVAKVPHAGNVSFGGVLTSTPANAKIQLKPFAENSKVIDSFSIDQGSLIVDDVSEESEIEFSQLLSTDYYAVGRQERRKEV
jgi:hypothetical protein